MVGNMVGERAVRIRKGEADYFFGWSGECFMVTIYLVSVLLFLKGD